MSVRTKGKGTDCICWQNTIVIDLVELSPTKTSVFG